MLKVPNGITTYGTTSYGPLYTGLLFSHDFSSSRDIAAIGDITVGAAGSITGHGTATIPNIGTVSAITGNFTNSGATTMTGDLAMGLEKNQREPLHGYSPEHPTTIPRPEENMMNLNQIHL
jgi:hypothetical protein